MSSPIIIGSAGDKYEQMAAAADAQELQQEMFAGLVQMVTENVIGNLLNSPIGIVYYDENGEVCEKEKSSGYEPEKQNLADSGYDLKSAEDFVIKAGERYTSGLKIGVLLPSHMDLFILPRSGHAHKLGITVVNSPGLIDQSYLGYEIKVILLNTGKEDWVVKKGTRIAQARMQLKGVNMMMKEFKGDLKDLQDKVSRKGGLGSTN